MKTGCTAEGFFVVDNNCKMYITTIFCPHCGTTLEWEFCSIEENPRELYQPTYSGILKHDEISHKFELHECIEDTPVTTDLTEKLMELKGKFIGITMHEE